MRWYADDSDIRAIKTISVPNIILFGGIIVEIDKEQALRNAIEDVKKKYGSKRAPIKWNFKDLNKIYQKQNKLDLWKGYLQNMHNFRSELFEAANQHDFKVIISVIQGYSTNKHKLNELKEDLTRHAFSNALMRFGLHVQEINPVRAEVVVDWPDKNNSHPFDAEYCSAYNSGDSLDKIKYNCGSLSSLKFNDSVCYTKMTHSTLLQLSDMILGATREFIEHCLDSAKCGHGVALIGRICSKYRGYPNNVMGRGIFFNSQATSAKQAVSNKFRELYVDS